MATPTFRTLPGKDPVRLASTDGHIIIIGAEAREVPENLVAEARAAGCISDNEIVIIDDNDGKKQSTRR